MTCRSPESDGLGPAFGRNVIPQRCCPSPALSLATVTAAQLLRDERRHQLGSPRIAEKAEAAPALLSVADESGLPALRAIALDWLVHNYPAAAPTPAFQVLSKPQSDMIAAAACSLLSRYQDLLQSLAHVDPLPSPSKPE